MEKTNQFNHGMTKTYWVPVTILCNPIINGVPIYANDKELVFAKEDTEEHIRQRKTENIGFPYSNVKISDFDFNRYSRPIEKLRSFVTKYVDYWEEHKEAGKAFYFWSKTPGSGKTFLSCCIGNSILDTYAERVRFITAADYLAVLKEQMNAEKGTEDKSLIYRECSLLILDDIGRHVSGSWSNQELFRLIDNRNRKNKPTIFTSNKSLKELDIDDAIKSRMLEMSYELQLPEESIRADNAKKNKDKFEQLVLGL